MFIRSWMTSFYVVILIICVFIYDFKVGFIEIVILMLLDNDLVWKYGFLILKNNNQGRYYIREVMPKFC